MNDRQNRSIGFVVALAAVGVFAMVAGTGAALMLQTPRVGDVRPIVTDRPLDAQTPATASSATGIAPSNTAARPTASALEASAARTTAAAALSGSVKQEDEDDHEVVKPEVRDEEHSDGVTRTWPYDDESSPSGSEESHK